MKLIDWLKLLMSDDIPDEILKQRDQSKVIPPLYGALLKNEQDIQLLERLAFMAPQGKIAEYTSMLTNLFYCLKEFGVYRFLLASIWI